MKRAILFLAALTVYGQTPIQTPDASTGERVLVGNSANAAVQVVCINPTSHLPESCAGGGGTGTNVTITQGGNDAIVDATGALKVLASIDTTGLATSALQTTGNTTLSSILSALGSVAVTGPLTDTQIRATPLPVSGTVAATQSGTWNIGTVTTLPSITGTVTANAGTNLNTSALALESGGNLATIVTNTGRIPAQGQALAAASLPVVLTAAQISTLTPLSSVTVTQGTGTNLHTVVDSGAVTATLSAETTKVIGTVNISSGQTVGLAAGTAGIGKLTANSGVTIGAVEIAASQTLATVTTVGTVTSITNALPAGTNAIGKLAANSGVDIGDIDPSTPASWGIGATAASVPANANYVASVGKSAQPTAVTDGQLVGQLASLDGALYTRPGGPILFSCGVTAIGTTLTQCQAAPSAGLSLYITDVVTQSNTTTAGLFTLRFGTGSNCGTGTGNLFFGSASALMASPANTVAVNHFHLTTPIKVTAANAICVLGVVTNTTNAQITGFTAP